ncbi:hypothetical protein BGX38DRAFT_348094 [Terfezia claveryi]|nr:hypothetical protein BGX38DRAFT_348094 [Terfezia claveryi]
MKFLSALVLAIPFVIAAPVPEAEGDVAVAPASATNEATLPVSAPEDGTKPIDAAGKKGLFRAGDKVYPSKEALTEALKKKGAQAQDGQYPYVYDYYGYPQTYQYPAASTYDYTSYPYYLQDPYAADYAAYYKAQKEQADYEQALKEYEYKKYLYDTDQTHLRPDLFPDHQVVAVPKQQEIEQQIVQVEKPEAAVARPTPKPLSHYKPPKPVLHEQAPYKYQFDDDNEDEEVAQVDQVNFHHQPEHSRPEHNYVSNFHAAPVAVEDRKFQAQPQRIEQAEREFKPKKQTPRPRFEELPEHRNPQYIKQNEDTEPPYFPAETAYYPKAADKPRFRPANPPSISVAANAANAAKEPEAPVPRESIPRERVEREREPRVPVTAPVAPSQAQSQSQRPSLSQYQRPKPEVLNNHNFNPPALSGPAPVPYQHNQQFRPSTASHEERIGQGQVYPRETTALGVQKHPAGGAGVNPDEKMAAGNAGIANANFVIFNRDTGEKEKSRGYEHE